MLVVHQSQIPPGGDALTAAFKTLLLNTCAVLLISLAAVLGYSKVKQFRNTGEEGARVWFYDQGAQRLYPARRYLISPDGDDDRRVRAMVIGFQGMGNEVSQLKIAYLEKYSPGLKGQLERAMAAHAARLPFKEKIPAKGSLEFDENMFVKRPGEAAWHSADTEEARRLMTEWRDWRGPSGQMPIISVPSMQ